MLTGQKQKTNTKKQAVNICHEHFDSNRLFISYYLFVCTRNCI